MMETHTPSRTFREEAQDTEKGNWKDGLNGERNTPSGLDISVKSFFEN
jgi:hypothetical protein